MLVARTEIKEWGNSLAVRIPKQIKDILQIRDGSKIKISLEGNKIILESDENSFFNLSKDSDLEKLFKKMTPKNRHCAQEFTTTPRGKEIW